MGVVKIISVIFGIFPILCFQKVIIPPPHPNTQKGEVDTTDILVMPGVGWDEKQVRNLASLLLKAAFHIFKLAKKTEHTLFFFKGLNVTPVHKEKLSITDFCSLKISAISPLPTFNA